MNLKIDKYFDNLLLKAIENAKKSIARQILFFLAFVEAIFFPIPVDPLLGLLVLAEKNRYIYFTIICTLGSVFGGLMGWLIGYFIGPSVQDYLVKIPFITYEAFLNVENAHQKYGSLIIFLGAFTPLPFKLIAITSGVFKVNLINFIIMSFLGRGIRFLLISLLVKIYGEKVIKLLKKKLFLLTTLLGVITLIIIYIYE